jgi:hypothetical protein
MTRLLRFLEAAGLFTVAVTAGYLAGCWVREVRRARADAARWQATRSGS